MATFKYRRYHANVLVNSLEMSCNKKKPNKFTFHKDFSKNSWSWSLQRHWTEQSKPVSVNNKMSNLTVYQKIYLCQETPNPMSAGISLPFVTK